MQQPPTGDAFGSIGVPESLFYRLTPDYLRESFVLRHVMHPNLSRCSKGIVSLLIAALLVLFSGVDSGSYDLALPPFSPGAPSPAFTATTSAALPSSKAETPGAEPPGSGFKEPQREKDWKGVWRDTGILFGSQVAAVGIIYLMPESVSGWSDEQKRKAFEKYDDNVGHPVFDKDKFYINYILHPYWGAAYYVRARERGLDKDASFVYSTLMSAVYEFGVECFFEKPSIQDLVVTPMVGSLIGAYLFEPLRHSIRRKQQLCWYDNMLLIATDPVGVLSSGLERMLGMKSTLTVRYSPRQLRQLSSETTAAGVDHIDVLLQLPLH